MVGECYRLRLRQRLTGEIRESDDLAAERADAMLAALCGETWPSCPAYGLPDISWPGSGPAWRCRSCGAELDADPDSPTRRPGDWGPGERSNGG